MDEVLAILAVWRLTELVVVDEIFRPIRRRWPGYVWTCQRCVSVWAGIVVTAAYGYVPWFNWPLGLSALYLGVQEIRARYPLPVAGKALIVQMDGRGNVVIQRSDFNAAGLATIAQALTQFANQKVSANGDVLRST